MRTLLQGESGSNAATDHYAPGIFLRSSDGTGCSLTPGMPPLRNSMPARSSVGQRRGAGANFALEGFQAADRADGDTARYSFNPFDADGFPAKRLQHKGKDG